MKKFLALFCLLFGGAFAADTVQEVDWEEAVALSKKGAVFLDVRTPEEVAAGAVTGALTIPLAEIQARFAELPKDKTLLVYCRSGARSMKASEFLLAKGLDVRNVKGGFLKVPPASVLPHN